MEFSRFRHDFKNEMQVVYSLIGSNDTEAGRLARSMNERLDDIVQISYCADPVVNVVLTIKVEEAKKQGITTTVITDVDNWNIAEIDRSNLFSNLLDNALEGCASSGAEQPFIRLTAYRKKGVCAVLMENSCAPDYRLGADGLPKTAKQDREHHGYGLRILRSIAERHHGQLRLKCADGVFTTEVFLTENA